MTTTQSLQTPTRVYRIGELADRFGVSEQSIRNWVDNGILPPVRRTPSGHRRFGKEHVRALIAHVGDA